MRNANHIREVVVKEENMLTRKTIKRVRVLHDDPGGPRKDMDLMCEIEDANGYRWGGRRRDIREKLINLVVETKAWSVVEKFAAAADTELPDLDDEDTLKGWLAQLEATELLTKVFWTGNHEVRYLAHTSPEMCERLGVLWEDAAKAMDGEIETFKQWAEGDVWGVIVSEATLEEGQDENDLEDEDFEEKESVWGFYGLEADNGMREHVPEELWPQLAKAMENPCHA
jgi:hypothetical protein